MGRLENGALIKGKASFPALRSQMNDRHGKILTEDWFWVLESKGGGRQGIGAHNLFPSTQMEDTGRGQQQQG